MSQVVYFLVAAAVAGLLIWLVAPRWYIRRFHPKIERPEDRAELEDKYRATTGSFLVLLGGLFGGGLAYLDYVTKGEYGRVEAVASIFPTAMNFLNGKSESDQIAGVHMLKAISGISPGIQETVVAVLATHVRKTYSFDRGANTPACITDKRKAFRSDVTQAIVNVLGAVNWEEAKGIFASFKGVDMAGAYFRNLDFRYGEFVNACLHNTAFDDARFDCADFSGAILTGEPNFTGATLDNALLANIKVDGGYFKPKSMKGAMLVDADFSMAKDSKGKPALDPIHFEGACRSGDVKFPEGFDASAIRQCQGDTNANYMRICRTEARRIPRDH